MTVFAKSIRSHNSKSCALNDQSSALLIKNSSLAEAWGFFPTFYR